MYMYMYICIYIYPPNWYPIKFHLMLTIYKVRLIALGEQYASVKPCVDEDVLFYSRKSLSKTNVFWTINKGLKACFFNEVFFFQWNRMQEGAHRNDAAPMNLERSLHYWREGKVDQVRGWRRRCLWTRVWKV